MAKYENMVQGDFDAIVTQLDSDIMKNGMSMQLVDESFAQFGGTRVIVRVYDKYYMRNESRASLSLTVVSDGKEVAITAIGAGGGKGAFFNFSWGAEGDMVEIVARSMERMGY